MREYRDGDFPKLCEWWCARDKAPAPKWSMPNTGFIEEEFAAGFIILLSNKCGILDFYVSNPHASRSDREAALFEITEELIIVAKEVGVKMITFTTQSESIKELGKHLNFNYDGEFSAFSKEL